MEITAQRQHTLLDAFLNNKEVLLKEFYIAEYPKTKYYILKNGGTIDNANDVFQEAFFACWKKLSTGQSSPKNKSEIEAYLFTTAKNKWIDQIRIKDRKKTVSLDEKVHLLPADESTPISEVHEKEEQLTITLNESKSNIDAKPKLLLYLSIGRKRKDQCFKIRTSHTQSSQYKSLELNDQHPSHPITA